MFSINEFLEKKCVEQKNQKNVKKVNHDTNKKSKKCKKNVKKMWKKQKKYLCVNCNLEYCLKSSLLKHQKKMC